MRYKESFHCKPTGRHPDAPTEPPPHPAINPHIPASCLRYLTPVFPPPASAYTLPKPSSPRFIPGRTIRTLPRTTGRGREVREKRYVPSRHQGVRRGARTGSLQEQGTYRLDPSNPSGILNSWPNRHLQPKIKTPHHLVRGSGRAADGNRTRVSGLGSVRSTIELQPHPLQSSVYPAGS